MSSNEYEFKSGQYHNRRGVIADNYIELQALHILNDMKSKYPLPMASRESTLRAILQSAEVALLNIAKLVSGAADDIQDHNIGTALIKMSWACGFHHVLVNISLMPNQLGYGTSENDQHCTIIRLAESPALQEYAKKLHTLDRNILLYLESMGLLLTDTITHKSLDDNFAKLIQIIRLCNHETTIWEHNLSIVSVPGMVEEYKEFVRATYIHDMVYDRELKGNTYFTQFRGLHQIPEILTSEINDCIELSIQSMRNANLRRALECLMTANILFLGVTSSIYPIAENLTTADYHQIRENLGVTSGSHSENIHYFLFRDLYGQIGEEFSRLVLKCHGGKFTEDNLVEAIEFIDRERFNGEEYFMINLLGSELLKLRAFVFHWRDGHLHLPRNTVGSDAKSLKGSSDAVQAVRQMRQIAFDRDPLRILVQARNGCVVHYNDDDLSLSEYLRTDKSLDTLILDTTGEITKKRFTYVQDRTGIFAEKGNFTHPKRREA